jgi:hypothetical protein
MKKRCTPGIEEQAILDFSASYVTTRTIDIYAKATEGGRTLASYHSSHDGRSFSLVFGDAEQLISQLVYFSEEGKTRLLDGKWKTAMLKGVHRLRTNGYRIILVAETQTRVSPGSMPSTFSDLKLLGFFALRKGSDIQAIKTLNELEKEGKKVFFIHDGEDTSWLKKRSSALRMFPF